MNKPIGFEIRQAGVVLLVGPVEPFEGLIHLPAICIYFGDLGCAITTMAGDEFSQCGFRSLLTAQGVINDCLPSQPQALVALLLHFHQGFLRAPSRQ